MIDEKQFLGLVIRPALDHINLGGWAAERLVLGTALTESRLTYLRQLGRGGGFGPARGVCQMEPNTHDDIWKNWLAYNTGTTQALYQLRAGQDPHDELVFNLAYAVAMCRVHYRRVPAPLPAADDAPAMAAYHKQHYNTPLGATDPAESVRHFERAIAVAVDLDDF